MLLGTRVSHQLSALSRTITSMRSPDAEGYSTSQLNAASLLHSGYRGRSITTSCATPFVKIPKVRARTARPYLSVRFLL